ncbi:MAG: carboxypeptidase regulatory-like domain-containing protein, partial [Planctomycetaceae bacterium]|nr:carboxypeptidase regulatory-like domain-containing protein [Planctomycetaceae bacterium]
MCIFRKHFVATSIILTIQMFLAIVILSGYAIGQSVSETQSECSITLKFLAPEDKPIPHATAEIRTDLKQNAKGWNDRVFKVKADENGIAVVPYKKEGMKKYFIISVKTAGFTPFYADWQELDQDPIPTEYTFRLDKAMSIGGVVFDDSGKPLAGVNVGFSFPWGIRQRIVRDFYWYSEELTTDENGRWKYELIPEECLGLENTFTFKHRNFKTLHKQMSIAKFKSNEKGEFATSATMQKGITVVGNVIDAEGKPVADAVVYGSNGTQSYQPEKTKTDEKGRFEFKNWNEAKEQYITVRAKGFAPEMKDDIWIRPNMEPIKFTLKAGKTIRAKVIDAEGKPVPNVWFALEKWRTQRFVTDEMMGGRKTTNAEGIFVWENAPEDKIVFDLLPNDKKYRTLRSQSIVAQDSEYLFTVQPVLKISGKVFDAQTGEKIPEFKMLKGSNYNNYNGHLHWDMQNMKLKRDGLFDVSYDDELHSLFIKIEANGYTPKMSREIDLSETNVDLDFAMEKSTGEEQTGISGIVNSPDGKPIRNAAVAIVTKNQRPSIINGIFWNDVSSKTDDNGRFTIPPVTREEMVEDADNDFKLIVIHSSGFAQITKDDFQKANKTIKLEKWARVEGTIQIGSEVGKEKKLTLELIEENQGRNKPQANFDYNVTSDLQGKFVFENVPAGKIKVARMINFAIRSGGGGSVGCYSHGQNAEAKSGETVTLKLGGTGCPVIGKLTIPDDFEGTPNWNFCHVTVRPNIDPQPKYPKELQELHKMIPAEILNEDDNDKRQTLLEEWKKTDAGKKYENIRLPHEKAYEKANKDWRIRDDESWGKQIACAVDENGNFRLDDVPAGNWEITIELTTPPPENQCGYGERVGYLKKVITVPDIPEGKIQTDKPFDLGILMLEKVKPLIQLITVGTEAPDFELKRLVPTKKGKDEPKEKPKEEIIKLSNLRGKTIIINFWATWCGPCLEKMPELVQL